MIAHLFKLAFWQMLDTHIGVARVVRCADSSSSFACSAAPSLFWVFWIRKTSGM
jgi:hypothetical protein